MTLFDLITVISFFSPIAASAIAGWNKGGLAGLLVGVVAGSVVGVVNIRGARIVGFWLVRHIPDAETPLSNALVCLFYLALLAWALGSSFLAAEFSKFVVQAFAARG